MMPPPRACNCGKQTCFTCHRRAVNERYRATHMLRHRPVETRPRVTDEELDRRALESLKRDAAPALYDALNLYVEHFGDPFKVARKALAEARGE